MPKNTAKTRHVVFFVYPGVKLLDLAGPLQVFNDAQQGLGNCAYRTAIVSAQEEDVLTDTAVKLHPHLATGWNEAIHTLVVVGGQGAQAASRDTNVIDALKALAGQSSRIASICTGAFLLGAVGLLNGRKAVTHWQYCNDLSRDYPAARVDPDSIFTRDGHIWTSAGVTAGIDLALALVREDLGREAAMRLARELVVFAVRPGGQTQFSPTLRSQVLDQSNRFDELHAWMQDNLEKDLRVEVLSDHVGMSPRNFARQYLASTGCTPAKTVEAMRVEAAREYLEETDVNVARVAELCGFRSDERMRKSFIRTLGVPPQDYRIRFQNDSF